MNERILELAAQAGYDSEYSNDYFSPEEFAELIVKECIGDFEERIRTRYQGDQKSVDVGYGMEIVIMEIKQKFGVEQ